MRLCDRLGGRLKLLDWRSNWNGLDGRLCLGRRLNWRLRLDLRLGLGLRDGLRLRFLLLREQRHILEARWRLWHRLFLGCRLGLRLFRRLGSSRLAGRLFDRRIRLELRSGLLCGFLDGSVSRLLLLGRNGDIALF